jgi:exosortase/archaeosortase family protein
MKRVEPARAPKSGLDNLRPLLARVGQSYELRFVVSFAVVAGALFSLYSFPYPEGSTARRWSDSYLTAYAHLAGWVLSAFEHPITVAGQNIVGRYSLRIVRGCDAIDAQILLVAAVLASSSHSWPHRLWGAAVGFLVITVANVVRICSLYYAGSYLPAYFDFFHHEVWPLLLIVIAVVAFVVWSRSAPGFGKSQGRPAGAAA